MQCVLTPPPDTEEPHPDARYAWTLAFNGATLHLCERCCAIWREVEAAEGGITPSRIVELEKELSREEDR